MGHTQYLYFNVEVLKALRIYKRSGTKCGQITDFFVRFVCNALLICSSISLGVHIKRNGMFQFESNAMSYAFLGGAMSVLQRGIYFWTKREQLENIVLQANRFFKYTSNTLLEEKNIQRYLSLVNKLTFLWLLYTQILCVLFCFFPNLFRKSKERTLPIPMWIPYEWKSSPIYEITYFLQVTFMSTIACIQSATDAFFAAVTLLAAEQFKLLAWEFKNLLYTNLIKNGIPKEKVIEFRKLFNSYEHNESSNVDETNFESISTILESEKFNEDMLNSAFQLIAFHQSLLTVCSNLEEFLAPLMLMYYAVLMLISLCLNYAVLSTQDMSLRLLFFPLSLTGYIEMFFPCYIANILTMQAERLRTEMYEMPWYICHKKFKVIFKYLYLKVRMPVTLTVGYFAALNLNLFLWAGRTINSYSIMIYQLNH